MLSMNDQMIRLAAREDCLPIGYPWSSGQVLPWVRSSAGCISIRLPEPSLAPHPHQVVDYP